MPVRVAEQEAEIAKYERLVKSLAPGFLRKDAERHLRQLQKDLAECKMYLAKGGQNNAGDRS